MSEPLVRVSEPKVSRMVDQMFASWNPISDWLKRLAKLASHP